jgi:hypothetical protein
MPVCDSPKSITEHEFILQGQQGHYLAELAQGFLTIVVIIYSTLHIKSCGGRLAAGPLSIIRNLSRVGSPLKFCNPLTIKLHDLASYTKRLVDYVGRISNLQETGIMPSWHCMFDVVMIFAEDVIAQMATIWLKQCKKDPYAVM